MLNNKTKKEERVSEKEKAERLISKLRHKYPLLMEMFFEQQISYIRIARKYYG